MMPSANHVNSIRHRSPAVNPVALTAVAWDLRLEGDTITGLSDGATLATWTGAVGSATQATGTKQPIYRTTGTLPNSQPVVSFDGTDDFLSSTLSASTAATVFIVAMASVAGVQNALLGASTAGGWANRLEWNGATAQWALESDGTAGIGKGAAFTPGISGYHLYVARYANPGTYNLRVDGALQGSGTSATTFATGKTTVIGRQVAGNYWSGPIAAVLVRSAVLSDSDMTGIEVTLKTKYGIS